MTSDYSRIGDVSLTLGITSVASENAFKLESVGHFSREVAPVGVF